jgi:hypothetical protein
MNLVEAHIFGARGDGVTDDTLAFATLRELRFNVITEGAQVTTMVTHIPSGKTASATSSEPGKTLGTRHDAMRDLAQKIGRCQG